jgi:hypothetical protein
MADDLKMTPEHEKDELLKIFEQGERSYFTRLVDMCKGFGKPKDSLEFKQAIIEFQRLGAPIVSVLVLGTAITVMSLVKFVPDEKPPVVETQIIEPEPAEELVKEDPPPPEEPPELLLSKISSTLSLIAFLSSSKVSKPLFSVMYSASSCFSVDLSLL